MIHLVTVPIKTVREKTQLALNNEFISISSGANINVFNINDADDFQPIILEGHRRNISALLFCVDADNEDVLFSASSDYIIQWKCNAIRFASAQAGHKVKGQVVCSSEGSINYISFHSLTYYLAACVDKSIYVYETKNKTHLATLEGHDSIVTAAEFSPFYDSTVISISYDRTFKVWGLSSMSLLFQSSIISSSAFISISCNPYHNSVALGTTDGIIRIFDLTDGSGYRQLHKIDMTKLLKKDKLSNCEEAKRSSTQECSKVINAKRSMQNERSSEGEDEEDLEVGTSILQMHFLSQEAWQKKTEKDIRNILDITKMVLICITNEAIVKLNYNNLEIMTSYYFSDLILTMKGKSVLIGVSSNALISKTLSNDNKILCVIEKLFSNELHVVAFPLTDNNLTDRPTSPEATWQLKLSEKNVISVLSSTNLDINSPLKSQLVPKLSKPEEKQKPVNKKKNSSH